MNNNQDTGRQSERARHSPGPWKIDNNRHRRDDTRVESGGIKWLSSQRAVVDAAGVIVADLHCWEYEEPDTLHWYTDDKKAMLANARLVQLAPELLAALKGLVEHCTMRQEAEAAIAAARAAIAKAEGEEQTE